MRMIQGLLIGCAAGALFGVLFAPKRGKRRVPRCKSGFRNGKNRQWSKRLRYGSRRRPSWQKDVSGQISRSKWCDVLLARSSTQPKSNSIASNKSVGIWNCSRTYLVCTGSIIPLCPSGDACPSTPALASADNSRFLLASCMHERNVLPSLGAIRARLRQEAPHLYTGRFLGINL